MGIITELHGQMIGALICFFNTIPIFDSNYDNIYPRYGRERFCVIYVTFEKMKY